MLRKAEIIVKDDTQVGGGSDRWKNNTVGQMNRRDIDFLELSRQTNEKNSFFKNWEKENV